jgi:uncharacterized protein
MRWIVAAALTALIWHASAASFDCAKASTQIERQVCANPQLSDLDGKLADAYKGALSAAEGPSKSDLQLEQRHWIAYVRNVCDSDACLSNAYVERTKLLARNERTIINEANCEIPDGKSCRSVVTYRDTSARMKSFNQSLRTNHSPGSVIGCSRLIDLPVGFRGSNHSFGGFCTLQTEEGRKNVKICNDDMVGRFAIEPVSSGTDAELRDFTNERCFGG